MQKSESEQSHDKSKVLFKGWILTYQSVTAQNKYENLQFKWTPKFLIIDKDDKTVRLFDYEPLTSKIDTNNNDDEDVDNDNRTDTTTSSSNTDDAAAAAIVYRIDNFINRESFFGYWKTHGATLINYKLTLSRDLSPLNEHNHHLSNKEIEALNYDSQVADDQQDQTNETATTVNEPSTFRFANFFKKNSLSAAKPTNLKRAKSGIQLERKKLFNNLTTKTSAQQHKASVDITATETKSSLPAIIRPSRSHESLATPIINGYTENGDLKHSKKSSTSKQGKLDAIDDQQFVTQINDAYLKLDKQYSHINSTHNSILNQENCFEIKYTTDLGLCVCKYFLCRNQDEKDKWLFILKHVLNRNYDSERHSDNALQLCVLEAKGNGIQQSNKKKYFCEILIDNCVYARTCLKDKKDILFWGENFEFNSIKNEQLRIDLYQEIVETKKKKKEKPPLLVGSVYIQLNSIDNNQSVEKWYRLEIGESGSGGGQLVSSSSNNTIHSAQIAGSITSESSTTTNGLNNTKDSISLRIKAKYQSVDILPLNNYDKLIKYFEENYLNIIQTLEPHLNVRLKDDLSNTLIRIAYKLQIVQKYLSDIILNEVTNIEDTSLVFRGNSIATKSIESYMKLIGDKYLKHTLSDIVKDIIDTAQDFEIDPSKVTNQSNLQANREEFIQILHLVCGRVFNSYNRFPYELKQVFCMLREECLKIGKTDEMCDMLISACIFLRYICPAILSPNLFNLTQEYPHEKAVRRLTLAAKTLQTIANFSKFGGKEFYMSFDKMNLFVEEHTLLMKDFLRSISITSTPNTPVLNGNHNSEATGTHRTAKQSVTTTSSPESSLPQTPISSSRSSLNTNNNTNDDMDRYKKEIPFNSDLIDLGKQLSILHTILANVFVNLDQANKDKLSKLNEILVEIQSLKHKGTVSVPSTPSSLDIQEAKQPNLFVYDNQYHRAVMAQATSSAGNNDSRPDNRPTNIQIKTKSPSTSSLHTHSATTTPTKIAAFALDQVQSATNIVEKSINNNFNESKSSLELTIKNDFSAPTTPKTPTKDGKFDFLNPSLAKIKSRHSAPKPDIRHTEHELNSIIKHLQETETELKREQKEKTLLEHKFKQQQQDHNNQMNNLIEKLMKLEDELRKEKNEMNKLLKAKEDLIEIQKKRIDSLVPVSQQPIRNSHSINNVSQQLQQQQRYSTVISQQPDTYKQTFYPPKSTLNNPPQQLNRTSSNTNGHHHHHSTNFIRTSEL